ncbi:MAG: cyclophilin family peptidyl-prolyl cis-trans isomerase [Verrucomicrobiales bacterium]|jgi:cyclophilin family peptidyl-prolyl cis-trans isomerase
MTRFLSTIIASTFLIASSCWAGPKVVFETSLGNITIELDEENAPDSSANFLKYVDAKHYDGIIFHRVIKGFMIQTGGFALEEGGDVKQKKSNDEIKNEADNGLKNKRGTLAMARTSDPHSASAQFFINHGDNNNLDHTSKTQAGWGYAVFGKVIEGMEVVDKIADVETARQVLHALHPSGQHMPQPMGDVPVEKIVIKSAKRLEE